MKSEIEMTESSLPGRGLRRIVGGALSILPASAPMWIYTRLLSFGPLRSVTHALLRRITPPMLLLPEGTLILNRDDPIVSGALALGAYERETLDRWRELIRDGTTVLDVGANIGTYTLIAAHRNPSGRVLAIEPSSENAAILEQMVRSNAFQNVTVIRSAAGATSSRGLLHLESDNKGLHSLIPSSTATGSEEVSVRPVDELLGEAGVQRVDLIKIDVEGYESKVVAGMSRVLERDHPAIIFEFMPQWIVRAGDDPLALLETLRNYGYGFTILGDEGDADRDLSDFVPFLRTFKRRDDYVNLLAIHGTDAVNMNTSFRNGAADGRLVS